MEIKNVLVSVAILIGMQQTMAQAPAIEWAKIFGGTGLDGLTTTPIETSDGGYLFKGYTYSNDGDVSGNHGGMDAWIVKLDASRDLEWQKTFGGSGTESVNTLIPTPDGGFIMAGNTSSSDGDVVGWHTGTASGLPTSDIWIVKLDAARNIQWQKCFGGAGYESLIGFEPTADGGYIVSGSASSSDGDVIGNHGGSDVWVLKLDNACDIQWQKCFGGTGNDNGYFIRQASDGGYIFVSTTFSTDGDVTSNNGGADGWFVKLDNTGSIEWQKSIGGTGNESLLAVRQTADGGYIAAGSTWSNDGDVSGNHGGQDAWLVKMSDTGTIQWQQCFGGTNDDSFGSASQTSDGGYIAGGNSKSNDGDVNGNHGDQDGWVIKLDNTITIEWQRCFGGTGIDGAAVYIASGGGYYVWAYTSSNDGDISGNHGGQDAWIAKLEGSVGLETYSDKSTFLIYPNPASSALEITTNNYQEKEIKMYDVLGTEVLKNENLKMKSGSIHVDVSSLSNGIYFLQMGNAVQKFLKQ
ncbi:MAG TPA: T9SS type A sorting domain-containing protein [Bacteroidia bacterium]